MVVLVVSFNAFEFFQSGGPMKMLFLGITALLAGILDAHAQ